MNIRAGGCIGLILLTSLLTPAAGDEPARPRVEANGALLTGAWEGDDGDVAAFKGVPFAAPPVGDLRWRAPHPAEPGMVSRDATTFAPACMQGPNHI